MRNWIKVKFVLIFLLLALVKQLVFAQKINFVKDSLIYSKRNLTINFEKPVISFLENIGVTKKINDSINLYVEHWKKEIPSNLENLFKEGGGILNDREYFAVKIEVDTITIFNNNIYILFNCMTDNIAGCKYTYWYDLLSYSLKDGKPQSSKLIDYFPIIEKTISLHELVEKGISEEVCKPRISFFMDDIVPLTSNNFYIPFSVDYSKDMGICMETKTLFKVEVTRKELQDFIQTKVKSFKKVLIDNAFVFKEPNIPSKRILDKGVNISVIDSTSNKNYFKIEYFYENTIAKNAWIKKSSLRENVSVLKILTIESQKAIIYTYPTNESKYYLAKGNKIDILEEKDNYYYIRFKGKKLIEGWVQKDDCSK